MSSRNPELTGLRPETVAAIRAVEAALAVTARGVAPGAVGAKDVARDIVTPADVEAEDAIRRLLAQTPGYPVVGEERGGDAPGDGSPYWLVDPICGTTNFAAGLSLFCVNLALARKAK